jgi:hypothetical protein
MIKTNGWRERDWTHWRGRQAGRAAHPISVSFKNTGLNREYLELLLRQFIEYPRVVEVRHESWNNAETIAGLMRHNVGFCNIDQPLLGRSLAPTEHVTSGVGYVRLHGRNYEEWFDSDNRDDRYNYLYKSAELEKWKEKIETIAQKAESTFVIANNHFQAKAAVNALELRNLLEGRKVRAPADAGATLSRIEGEGRDRRRRRIIREGKRYLLNSCLEVMFGFEGGHVGKTQSSFLN